MDNCGSCEYLPLADKGGYAWCAVYPGHWNADYQRYTGGYCHLDTPACQYFKCVRSAPSDPEPFMAVVRAAVAVKNEADKLGEEGYQLEGSDSLALDALIDAVESLPDWGRRV